MKQKCIIYIDPQGGSGNLGMYDYELISRLKSNHIIFIGGKSYNYLPIKNADCKFWFNYGNKSNMLLKVASYICTLIRILFLIIKIRPSIAHIQWIRLPIFDIFYYSFIKKIFGVKLVYTVHNILPHNKKTNDEKYYGKMYRLCDALMVHTLKTKTSLIKLFNINPTKIHISPHGPLNYLNNKSLLQKEISLIKEKYSLSDKTIFCLPGYQSEYKGTDLLVNAWKDSHLLMESDNNILAIVGTGASEYMAEGQTGNIICISRKVSDLEFDSWIKISDVLVFPYRRIEQSGVLLTVVAERKPYCATDVGELATPVKQNNIGWIIPDVSVESIRETLEHIVENKEEINTKRNDKLAWDHVASLYDWGQSAKITSQVYESLQSELEE